MEIAELIRAVLLANGGDCVISDVKGKPYSQYELAVSEDFGSKMIRTSCRNRSRDGWATLIMIIEGDIVYASSWMGEHTVCIGDPNVDLEKWLLDLREGNAARN